MYKQLYSISAAVGRTFQIKRGVVGITYALETHKNTDDVILMKEPTHPDRIQADAWLRVKAIRLCILPLCELALVERTYIC
jgi:hypothetical protein